MKRFEFGLDRVLGWRRTQLEIEEQRLRQSQRELAAARAEQASTEALGIRTEQELRARGPIEARDLHALAAFQAGLKRRQEKLAARVRQCEGVLEEQRRVYTEARRRVRLLEQLRERRMLEWQTAADREIEDLASEAALRMAGSKDR